MKTLSLTPEALDALAANSSMAELSRLLKVGEKVLRRELRRMNILTSYQRRLLPIDERVILRGFFIENLNVEGLAKKLGRCEDRVRKDCRTYGIDIPRKKSRGGQNKANLIGFEVGKLRVLREYGRFERHVVWKCKCACGNITTATTSMLKAEIKKSCGCLKKGSA